MKLSQHASVIRGRQSDAQCGRQSSGQSGGQSDGQCGGQCGGQCTVEFTVLGLFLILLFGYSLNAISLGVSRLWLEQALYKSIGCELKSGTNCRGQTLIAARLLAWGEIQSLKITSGESFTGSRWAQGDLLWKNLKSNKNTWARNTDSTLHLTVRRDEASLAEGLHW